MSTTGQLLRTLLLAAGTGSSLVGCQQAQTRQLGAIPLPHFPPAKAAPDSFPQARNHRPDVGNRIDSKAGKEKLTAWTHRYQDAYPGLPKAYYINAALVAEILDQVDSRRSSSSKGGLRIYFGLDQAGEAHAILVAVRRDGTDVIERKGEMSSSSLVVGESDDKCPNNCDSNSILE